MHRYGGSRWQEDVMGLIRIVIIAGVAVTAMNMLNAISAAEIAVMNITKSMAMTIVKSA